MNTLPPEPEKPLPSDCCGGGACCPCVWDDYYDKLDQWRDAKKAYYAKSTDNETPSE